MGRLRGGSLLFLLLLVTSTVRAQSNALLVDRSGSMRPYYNAGVVRDLGGAIYDVLSRQGGAQILAFDVDVAPLPGPEALSNQPLGPFTYLDRAIDHATGRPYDIAWIITDNIESQPTDPDAGNTEVFYRRLRSDAVRKVVIFPVLRSPGTPGIVVYAVQISPGAGETFDREVNDFLGQVKGAYRTEALRMKPLDRDAVEVNLAQTAQRPKGWNGYKEGQQITEKLEARFKSRLEHLKIVDAEVEVPPAAPEFSAASLLVPEKREVSITPERVPTLDPQEESPQVYTVTADLGRVKLKKDLRSLWEAATRGKRYEDITLRIAFVIKVPQENFKFKDSFVRTYSAASLAEAKGTGKVYSIEKLPLLLSEATTPIVAENTLQIRVEYPWWPVVVLALLMLLLLGLLALVVFAAVRGLSGLTGRTSKWAVSAATERGTPLDCQTDAGRVAVQGNEVGLISRNVFTPRRGVKLGGGAESARIEDGLQLKVEQRGRLILLLFKRDGTGAGDGKGEPTRAEYIPQKR
jgi:hypothetical protein